MPAKEAPPPYSSLLPGSPNVQNVVRVRLIHKVVYALLHSRRQQREFIIVECRLIFDEIHEYLRLKLHRHIQAKVYVKRAHHLFRLLRNAGVGRPQVFKIIDEISIQLYIRAEFYIGAASLTLRSWPAEAEISTVSGGVAVRGPADESGFACVVSTVSGETDCGFDAAEEGGTYTLGAGEAALRISTTSGNVELAPLA